MRQPVNVLERAVILRPQREIRAENERRYLRRVLAHTHGTIYGADGAAALLGLPPTTQQSKLKKPGIR